MFKRLEPWLIFLLTATLLASVPIERDGLGLGWDTMNHHVYLGWVASGERFEQDYFAAASQSYQFPYLYWPVYQLTRLNSPGWVAGVLWAILHAVVSLPLWLIARRLMPGDQRTDVFGRVLAVMFGVGNLLVLRAPDTTGNDVLAAIPWLFAVAVGLGPADKPAAGATLNGVSSRALLCGVLGGVAVALKLSNATVAIWLPWVCLSLLPRCSAWWRPMSWCVVGLGMGFSMTYGWWGAHLWQEFGNPIFPFADGVFEPVRDALQWHGGAR